MVPVVSVGRRWLHFAAQGKRDAMREYVQQMSLGLGPYGGRLMGTIPGRALDGKGLATQADHLRFYRALAYLDLRACRLPTLVYGIVDLEVVRGAGWQGGELSLCEPSMEGALS